MPIYEYICEVCGYELEIIQRIKETPLTECPICKENALRKKLSVAAFHLKGSGWYETDFKNKKTDDEKSKKPETEDSKSVDSNESDKKDSSSENSTKSSSSSKTAESTT